MIFGFNKAEEEIAGEAYSREDWGDIVLWRFRMAPEGVNIVFSGRHGGVSQPPYSSLNLGFHVEDLPEHVTQNRALLANVLGVKAGRITSPRQQHTAIVELLENESQVGSGAFSEDSGFDPCDGLVTSLEQAPILLHFADCTPVVLTGSDSGDKPVIAVLHAGRKGVMEGVVENGVRLMPDIFSIPAEKIVAAVGPAIGACCYQVGDDIASEFESRFGPDVVVRDDEGSWLDMHSATETALLETGLAPENIHVLEICTCCDYDFYSYRRDGITGRHGAIAWIEER
ncbi:MAG: peptidoglycan editing factor PgeF [Actinobacteria bacterium]|nr:peptidoglycan editing factor PgeF [Actinomycetota bacterium]